MKKILILLILHLIIISCSDKTSKKIDYANELSECLSEKDIEILNEACHLFEEKLKKEYQSGDIGVKYKQYLKDINTFNVPKNFIKKDTPNDFIEKLKITDTFKKIWIKDSDTYVKDDIVVLQFEVTKEDSKQVENQEELDYYIVNPKGDYLQCLLKTNQNKYISEYLELLNELLNISPHILAGGLCNTMTDKEFDNKVLRLIIAVNFYYELKIIITD